jgi:hypothetical protein
MIILKIIAVAIGFWYARKYGREAVEKINKFNEEKKEKKY